MFIFEKLFPVGREMLKYVSIMDVLYTYNIYIKKIRISFIHLCIMHFLDISFYGFFLGYVFVLLSEIRSI